MPEYETLTSISLQIHHYYHPLNKINRSFKVIELDCSVRFVNETGTMLLSPFPLNTGDSAIRELPISPLTP